MVKDDDGTTVTTRLQPVNDLGRFEVEQQHPQKFFGTPTYTRWVLHKATTLFMVVKLDESFF